MAIELVNKDGDFHRNIDRHLNLIDDSGLVGVVCIMGVQSTGKSTLMNKCFFTCFEEMDYTKGMNQTTKGIWIAKCASQNGGRKILVIDTEGTDGSERGREGDDTFERKTAVFALAVSDVVIFNMKCDSVNLHQGSSRPLMETVFQVMVRKFSTPRQINVVFVLRDRNQCPLDALEQQLIGGLKEIWNGMSGTKAAAFERYFNIEVVALPHYRLESEQFDAEVVNLRERIFSLVQFGQLLPASSFNVLAETNWNDIKDDKILNLQLNRIKVADAYCNDRKEEKIDKFYADERWIKIQKDVESGRVIKGFGNDVSSIIGHYLSQYDEETQYLDQSSTNNRRTQLTQRLLKEAEQTYLALVKSMRDTTLAKFDERIVGMVRADGKLEGMDRDEFITEFKNLLKAAHIQQANGNHTFDEQQQIGKLELLLASHEEAADTIITQLKKLKKKERKLWKDGAMLLVNSIGASMIVMGTFLAPVVGTVAATGAAATVQGVVATAAATLPTASISSIILAFIDYKKAKRELKEARKQDPTVDALWKKCEKKQKGKKSVGSSGEE